MQATIKRAPTFVLKAVIVLIGVIALAICVLSFPMIADGVQEFPQFAHWVYLAFFGFYASAIPFFFALYQALKLLHSIDTNNAFSEISVKALKTIKFCAVAMSILYATAMPLVFIMSDLDDAPGGVVIGFAFTVAPLVVATFAAVLQKLIQHAVDLKSENDLTV